MRRAGHVGVGLGLALAAAGCSGANQSIQMQVPAVISGVVTARPPCHPGQVCSFLVALVPDAVVDAVGKDGSHEVHADAQGHYQLALLIGTWTLSARRTAGAPAGPSVRIQAVPATSRTVNLQVGFS